jgi:hypothetical protein
VEPDHVPEQSLAYIFTFISLVREVSNCKREELRSNAIRCSMSGVGGELNYKCIEAGVWGSLLCLSSAYVFINRVISLNVILI